MTRPVVVDSLQYSNKNKKRLLKLRQDQDQDELHVCRFRVSVSLSADFDANELTVKTIDRRLIVTAQRDETGPGRRASCREFHHEFDLPQSVEPETVTAHVTDDGQLVVEAPLPPALNTSAD